MWNIVLKERLVHIPSALKHKLIFDNDRQQVAFKLNQNKKPQIDVEISLLKTKSRLCDAGFRRGIPSGLFLGIQRRLRIFHVF